MIDMNMLSTQDFGRFAKEHETMRILTEQVSHPFALTVRAKTVLFGDPRSCLLLKEIRRVAPSSATVLISGETGTGKEIVARYVHELSPRAERPFVAVNCGAFSESLVDSELFGHEKGAFTGAVNAKEGWFEAANGGTLFLDEVGDLPLNIQVKLLRILQEREVVRLGSRTPKAIDVRLVAATNVDLALAVENGHFREDLFFRLNVMSLQVPALRERPGDILPLTEHFLRLHGEQAGLQEVVLSPEAIQRLLDHPWTGNIRELENVLHRAVVISQDGHIEPEDLLLASRSARLPDLPQPGGASSLPQGLDKVLREIFDQGGPDIHHRIDAAVVTAAYHYCHENQLHTAQLLGISRNILRAKLATLGFIPGRAQPEPAQKCHMSC